ncbi:hypothetical protein NS365_04580 [Aureimonas ureilytica]|uniref:Phage head-tail adapter protein n=1 Tax=Aureimonas ureilytica TaxID=401562 RepID=A0A175RUB7_9HYPH|nr:hypothetical protein NS365_04580 [Aureimonas ureilytica]
MPDGYGNTRPGPFVPAITVSAHIRYLKGSETVIASRLAGRQPVVIRVRRTAQTRDIKTDWRATDTRTGQVYNVRAIVPSADRAFLDITAESGGPD